MVYDVSMTDPEFWDREDLKLEDVKKCLKKGSGQFVINIRDREEYVPILTYAAKYLPEAIPVLVKAGFDVNAKGTDGQTPIVMACGWGVKPIAIKNLLEAGASASESVKTPWDKKLTPMKHFTAEGLMSSGEDNHPRCKDDCEILKLLLNAGAEQIDYNGKPLVHRFCQPNHELALKTVLECGCDPNIKDKEGETALTKLAKDMKNKFETAKLKTQYSKETTLDDKNMIVFKNYGRILDIFLSHDHSIIETYGDGILDSEGSIPFHWVQNHKGECFSTLTADIPFARKLIIERENNGINGVHAYIQKMEKEFSKYYESLCTHANRNFKIFG